MNVQDIPATLPITVILAVRNEEINVCKCLASLRRAARVVVVDSGSTDRTVAVAAAVGGEVVQFHYSGRYPRKRQWALENIDIKTPWVMFVDADEEVTEALWQEIEHVLAGSPTCFGYMVLKQFHFLGRHFEFGGFSHAGMFLVRHGHARFERLLEETDDGLDMEVHERVIVDGPVGHLKTPLVHRDFKGLDAYRERHRHYAIWEARLRRTVLDSGKYGQESIQPRLFGNAQERRRFLKIIAMRVPFEPFWWFLYHYLIRFAVLEGYPGWVACRVRYDYIRDVRARVRALKRQKVGNR